MAHYAELDLNNRIIRVIVIPNEIDTSESAGQAYCQQLLGGRWIKTSYNATIRGKFASIGDLYDAVTDEFKSGEE
jgi:hypothetical protein